MDIKQKKQYLKQNNKKKETDQIIVTEEIIPDLSFEGLKKDLETEREWEKYSSNDSEADYGTPNNIHKKR